MPTPTGHLVRFRPEDTLRDVVLRFPGVLEALINRGISPVEAHLTLAEVAARKHLRLPRLLAALERAAG